jgi:hypothetical protein
MDTSQDPNNTSPRHVLLDRADESLADAHEQLTRAGEEMARAEEQLSRLEQEATRTAARGKRSSLGGRAVRGLTGLVLAACVFAGAIVSQSSYGNAAKQIVGRWAPRLVTTAALPLDGSGPPAQLSSHVAQATTEQTALPQPALQQPAPPPQGSPQDAAPAAASTSPEVTQLLQSMARDLATLGQGIEELKTRQEQMARDNANAVEQLKASQDQMARAIAKASEAKTSEAKTMDARASAQNVRSRTSAPPLPQTATPAHRPAPVRPSPQGAARP